MNKPPVRRSRSTINRLVKEGFLPRPWFLPCTDCGHFDPLGSTRNEYDWHHEPLQPVCPRCLACRVASRAVRS
jgi:hypothetical protein